MLPWIIPIATFIAAVLGGFLGVRLGGRRWSSHPSIAANNVRNEHADCDDEDHAERLRGVRDHAPLADDILLLAEEIVGDARNGHARFDE